MVSRKRSKSGKKGWQTRRWNAVKSDISRRSFDVWEKIPKSERQAVLDFRLDKLKIEKGGRDKEAREAISNKIEQMGKRMSFFFDMMRAQFGLEDHEIKSILFSPLPRK